MGTSELYQLFLHHPQITTDSRNCPSGSLFFALKGKNFDGNQFAGKALDAGADYAVIDRAEYFRNERTILVNNVLETLQGLAKRHRKVLGIPLIAITGTNGKTTTKDLLAAVLSSKFNLLYTEGNLNNQIGLPLTLLRLTHEHEMAVIEMGASRPGDIAELTEIAQPNYGLITNVGRAHLEGFGSFDNVVKAKGELYDYIRHTKGVIFVRKEDKDLQAMAEGIRQVTYGSTHDAFASGRVADSRSPFLIFEWKQQGKIHTVETQLIGSYNLDNVMVAVAAGRYFKIPAERISRAIASYVPSNHRSQLKQTLHNSLIVDAYNANPDSMKAALRNFAGMTVQPKAVILGDMKELGKDSRALHREILSEVRAGRFDQVYLCGEEFTKASSGKGFTSFPTTEALMDMLRQCPPVGYYILIKGSRGMALERCIELL
ncbi:MAG: UDP-N-acetylmuramoyl-tripeptide--D-alanyl-D-alanine ligase [Tannerellaceae bacterium]|jgi:UDP-N-acetylmuramoyl-tripeptide--D-alanyl-D-alanine ligase|nr:UDP-N-acetylmuramoyl-tripeptide--D-alanyl-D-alanine ligase [Tannerellaceae bacterium]